jgi:hypothetical protein
MLLTSAKCQVLPFGVLTVQRLEPAIIGHYYLARDPSFCGAFRLRHEENKNDVVLKQAIVTLESASLLSNTSLAKYLEVIAGVSIC